MPDLNTLRKATDTEAWEGVKEAIKLELYQLKSIDYLLELNEKESKALSQANDPLRIGQMIAYRTLNKIFKDLLDLEASKSNKLIDDYL